MPKEQEQQTMEEYLLSQLDTPVVLKDGTKKSPYRAQWRNDYYKL